MKRDYKLFIDDIRECILAIENYTKGITEKEFLEDNLIQDAVIRRLEIMGEATKNIPMSLKEKNRQVSWFEMSQFRNLITHSYYGIVPATIWKTIKEKILPIKEGMKKIKLV